MKTGITEFELQTQEMRKHQLLCKSKKHGLGERPWKIVRWAYDVTTSVFTFTVK